MIRIFFLLILVACSSIDPCDFNEDGIVDKVEQRKCLGEPGKENDTVKPTLVDVTGSMYGPMPASGRELDLPIYLTTMTHMEGNSNDDKNEDLFNIHAQQLRFFMNLAVKHDAKITVESELPFAKANVLWNDNVMLELYEAGMGVGTHCDIGARDTGLTQEEFTDLLRVNKEAVDVLVGEENNWGCSGAGSHLDWAQAMQHAGFTYVNGIVGFHLQALPNAYRPKGYTDHAISKGGYFHHHIPTDVHDRMYLRYLNDTSDLLGDSNGIIMSAGSLGKLSSIAEGGYEPGVHIKDADLTREDVDHLVELIRQLDDNRDSGYISKIDLYFPAKELVNSNREVLTYFFEEMEALQDDDIIEWATQKEVAETFIAYN